MFHHFYDADKHIQAQGAINNNDFRKILYYLKENYNLISADLWTLKSINNSLEMSGGIVDSNITTSTEDIDDTNSILIENLTTGTYVIEILSDQNDCLDPIQEYLNVNYDDENCLWIPTVFSPNSDGINDTFEIYGMEYYPNAIVEIYNRWGQLIYESKNQLYIPWDGNSTIKDSSLENEIATYYYVIELNTGQKTYNGSITLKR